MGDLRRAASTMEQAIFLAPGDADLHFELGKILTNPEAAARHLTTATRIDPGQGLYWAHLAETLAQSFKRTGRESVGRMPAPRMSESWNTRLQLTRRLTKSCGLG